MIAKTLKCNQTLECLNIDNNRIGDEGAIALSEALTKNNTLKELHIEWNQLGLNSAQAFTKCLIRSKPQNSELNSKRSKPQNCTLLVLKVLLRIFEEKKKGERLSLNDII